MYADLAEYYKKTMAAYIQTRDDLTPVLVVFACYLDQIETASFR